MDYLKNPVVVAMLVAVGVAILGGAATDVGPWYQGLRKPSFNPPNWLFAPAWTVIYALAVIAAVVGWNNAETGTQRNLLIILFFFNAVLNVTWSFLFFTLKRPDWALAEVITLWISVLALVVFFFPFSRLSSLVLLPYLGWVGFAGFLNLAIVRLNGPFSPGA